MARQEIQMSMPKRGAYLPLALLFLPCADLVAQDAQRGAMSYLNAPEAELIDQLGRPSATEGLANGETILIYRRSRSETIGGYTVSNAEPLYPTGMPGGLPYSGSPMGVARRYVPEQTVKLNCEARFTVGVDKQVRDIQWEGEGC
jgi:hypothetical protein